MRDASLHIHDETPVATRSDELHPIDPGVHPSNRVAIHVTEHVGSEQSRGVAHGRLTADDGEQSRDERLAGRRRQVSLGGAHPNMDALDGAIVADGSVT
jgi:hypothetical protein